MDINNIEITEDIMQAVALAQLYREDATLALRKVISQKLTNSEMSALYRRILKNPRLKEIQQDIIKMEKATLFNEDMDTIMLYYNKLLQDAQFEKKYEVAARILGEIRKLKAIDNEQMKFEIVISHRPKPDDKEFNATDSNSP